MKTTDARALPAPAQEGLRRRAVEAVRNGMTRIEAARVFGVTRQTVGKWVGDWEAGGSRALQGKRRGRPPVPRRAPGQGARLVRLIVDRCPHQLRLPLPPLARGAVGEPPPPQVG